ncbi:fimbrial protein [Halobacteriovorax sp. HLS]|uniref:fimbrial protein n=1 Tax=Halobacteriovorax sp. HLS TaxID=2234000 RepID=UPI000FD8DB58|nr:fimbrial protein [Halobacteriovorax sp. HLS]
MKKLIMATVLASVVSAPVMAATQGTLLLQGQVDQVLSLTVNPVAGHDSLDLTASPVDLNVASVNEVSNAETGYKILVRSANASSLKNGTADQVDYTLSYGNSGALTLTTTDQVAKSVTTAGTYNVDTDVDISYTGSPAAELVQGTYSDTVTFTIQAN